jgi:hypothetical protein
MANDQRGKHYSSREMLKGSVHGSFFCSPSISELVVIFSRNIDIVSVERVAMEMFKYNFVLQESELNKNYLKRDERMTKFSLLEGLNKNQYMRFYRKVPGLGQKRNAGLTYSILAAISFKIFSFGMCRAIP